MKIHELPLPVPYHKTMEVLDSSKMQELASCPRKFFFRYVLGWTKEGKNIHLVFGQAIHSALEYLYNNGLDESKVADAYAIFMEIYRSEFDEYTDIQYSPKSPDQAYKALTGYVRKYKDDMKVYETVGTELSGTFYIHPEDESRSMIMKLDLILRHKRTGKVVVRDFKTARNNSRSWAIQWQQSIQMNNYILGAKSYYGEEFSHLEVDGIFLSKTKTGGSNSFLRVPIYQSDKRMLGHLATVNYLYDLYFANMKELATCSKDEPILRAFPKNPISCSSYGACPWFDICTAEENPLRIQDKIPQGIIVHFWNPLEEEND